MDNVLFVVVGAPGSGKTTTVERFLQRKSDTLVFDTDWLIETASKLANKNIISEQST